MTSKRNRFAGFEFVQQKIWFDLLRNLKDEV